jgi:translation initiation factor 2 alpha subunit (eIF-2alpha)
MEVGDIVICIVDRIIGTTVFVKIDGTSIEGSIVTSEIAPGRIRNLRDYVVPKKRIVCKVLRISGLGNMDLSLRRVTQKEKKEAIEKSAAEKSYKSILKSILKENAEKVLQEILKEDDLPSFLEEAKANPEKLERLIGKDDAKKILDVLKIEKKKKTIIKKEIHMTTTKPNGITLIKKVLEIFKGVNAKYIAAGKYSLEVESNDVKIADKQLRELIDNAEKESKKSGIEFSVK